jgi:hypothetical protein
MKLPTTHLNNIIFNYSVSDLSKIRQYYFASEFLITLYIFSSPSVMARGHRCI